MIFVLYDLVLSTFLYWFCLIVRKQYQFIKYLPFILVISANIYILLFLVNRWFVTGYFPLSNLYESIIFLTWCLMATQVVSELRTSSKIIGSILTPIQLGLIWFASSVLPLELQRPTSLVPALQSNWLMFHVSMMLFSYAILILGSATSILILFINSKLSRSNVEYSSNFVAGVKMPFHGASISIGALLKWIRGYLFGLFSTKWNLVNSLDLWSYRTISLGHIALTLGISSGSVWANESWGSYWSWDPKETWSLITWLIFTVYLHARFVNQWKSDKLASVAVVGFVSIWISYFGVNFLANGLHSYGSIA